MLGISTGVGSISPRMMVVKNKARGKLKDALEDCVEARGLYSHAKYAPPLNARANITKSPAKITLGTTLCYRVKD
jgi:hypothetical protein